MGKCTVTKEVVVSCKNEKGALARATLVLKQNNVNIECCCCYAMEDQAKFHFITNDNSKAKKYLEKEDWECTESEVCRWTAPNKPGQLYAAMTAVAEAGIDTEYCYTSSYSKTGDQDVVFCTNNNKKASQIFGSCGAGCGCG